jgi:hypothetical protein
MFQNQKEAPTMPSDGVGDKWKVPGGAEENAGQKKPTGGFAKLFSLAQGATCC